MALSDVRTQAQFLTGSTDPDLYRDARGTIQLRPTNLFPNQYGIEDGTDGEPVGWDLSGIPEKVVGYHYLVSRPGTPRRSAMQRQTTAFVPHATGAWTGQQAWLPGGKHEPDSAIKPEPPEVEQVANPTRGFLPGAYGYAYGYSSEFGPTTTTALYTVTLAAGQYPVLKVPDGFPAGAKTWDIYLTRAGGTVPFCQRRVPISRLTPGGDYPLYGPWQNRGRAPSTNLSGVGLPPRPRKNRDYRLVTSRFDMLKGIWRPGVQVTNERGYSVLSQLGRGIEVEPDLVRVKKPGPAPANATASAQAATLGPGPTAADDPRDIRPSGKRGEHEYQGHEIDWRESEALASINADRSRAGKDPLVLTQALNRAAYRKARGAPESVEDLAREEGYPGAVNSVPPAQALAKKWQSVGIAIEGETTVLAVGDYLEDDGITELYCEHYDADGNVHRQALSDDDVRAMVDLGWTLVSGTQMHYSYSGSYSSAVSHGASQWNAMGVISVAQGGTIQCAITDGSPNAGAIATTYSDGRMILSSYYMSRATTNAKQATLAHEFGHTLGFGHPSGVASVLNTPIVIDSSANYDTLTSYDKDEYRRKYGNATGGDGAQNPDPTVTEWSNPQTEGETPPDPDAPPDAPPEPEFHYEWVPGMVKKNTALFLRVPRIVLKHGGRGPGGMKYTYYLQHEAEDGTLTWHRAYFRHSRKGASMYFDDVGQFKRGIEVSAYPENKEPSGLRVGLISEDPPVEDTTAIEPPDPASVPDAPDIGGIEQLPAGTYLVSVQGVLESGALTRISEPATITLTGTNILKAAAINTVNLLRNPEFARLDSNGNPEDWTPDANLTAPATYSVADGVLTIRTPSTISPSGSKVSLDSAYIPVTSETVLTVAGSIGASNVVAGSARVSLQQFDASKTLIANATLTVGDLASAGEIVFSGTYGPGYTALDPAAAYVRLSPRMSGVSVNLVARFWDLSVVPFASSVRKVEDTETGKTFDTQPDTPVPGDSFAAAAPPLTPPGTSGSAPVAPLDVVDFEGGIVPATWAENGTSANKGVLASTLIDGAYVYRVQDASTTSVGTGYLSRTFTNAGNNFALRGIYRIIQRPSAGYIDFHRIRSTVAGQVARLRLYANGNLHVVVTPVGGVEQAYAVATGLTAGTNIDVEILYVNGKNGTLSVGFGANGAARQVVVTQNADFSGILVTQAQPGIITSNNAAGLYELYMDQIVVTERGDILDREKPATPTGYVPPEPDRPYKVLPANWAASTVMAAGQTRRGTAYPGNRYIFSASAGTTGTAEPAWPTGIGQTVTDNTVTWTNTGSIYREFDADGEPTKQIYIFLRPGATKPNQPVTVPLLEEPQPVRPGLTYGFGVFSRWSAFTADGSTGIRVWLEGENDDVEPKLALTLRTMSGTRGWHPAGQEDDYGQFTVPLTGGYTHARVEVVLRDGIYVFDSPLFTQGADATFAARDAKRGYGRATTAAGEFVMDLLPELAATTIQPGYFVSEAGVKKAPDETPVGTLTAVLSTSSDKVTWAPYTGPGSQPMRYLKAAVTLTGDGRDGPEIPRGGIYARTWTPVGVLLRPDGSHFPGVVWVGNHLVYEDYPDAEFSRVAGHVFRSPLSESIGRLKDVPLMAGSEAARQEISALASEDEFIVEVPHAGGTVAGEYYRVVFGEQPEWGASGVSMVWGTERLLTGNAVISEVEVLERAKLQSPMLPAISAEAFEIVGA